MFFNYDFDLIFLYKHTIRLQNIREVRQALKSTAGTLHIKLEMIRCSVNPLSPRNIRP